MSKFGKRLIAAMKEFLADLEADKPMRQSIFRRVIVKGKPTYIHTQFTAPLQRKNP